MAKPCGLRCISQPQPRKNCFGRRQVALKLPTAEECCRQLLGLPLDRRLSETEIQTAYKRLAKQAHPDAGGNVKAFLELSAARDALMKERRTGPRGW